MARSITTALVSYLLLTGLISQARADNDLPRYDVPALCKEAASFGGTYSAQIESGCFELEQRAYDHLKLSWAEVPEETRKLCDEAAQSGGGGSYNSLLGCIELEQMARTEMNGRRFKY